jgi:hypothetical protein
VLSDRDKRVLAELEDQFPAGAREPVRSRAARRRTALALLTCLLVGLVVVGVPVAAFALALATALGWGFWWLGSGRGHLVPPNLPGESVRRYLRWLAEAE